MKLVLVFWCFTAMFGGAGFLTAFADEMTFDCFDNNLCPPDTLNEEDIPGAAYFFVPGCCGCFRLRSALYFK